MVHTNHLLINALYRLSTDISFYVLWNYTFIFSLGSERL